MANKDFFFNICSSCSAWRCLTTANRSKLTFHWFRTGFVRVHSFHVLWTRDEYPKLLVILPCTFITTKILFTEDAIMKVHVAHDYKVWTIDLTITVLAVIASKSLRPFDQLPQESIAFDKHASIWWGGGGALKILSYTVGYKICRTSLSYRSCTSTLVRQPLAKYWQRASQSEHWLHNTWRLARFSLEYQLTGATRQHAAY